VNDATRLWMPQELIDRMHAVGAARYHDRHPFHRRMNEGRLTPELIRSWVANRFFYQKSIPIKDAALLSRCPLRDVRRVWIQRILDHDGTAGDAGGIEKWLALGEAVGLAREVLEQDRLLLPGVRFAVEGYVEFVRTHSWVEGVASSLTELFAPDAMRERLVALERQYPWIDPDGLAYFRARLVQAPRDSQTALALVLEHARTREVQERCVAALEFKCDVLWAQLDALTVGAPESAPRGARPVRESEAASVRAALESTEWLA